jgi:hypothetical protein
MGREERRELLEQRRSAVAHQVRRLAIELTDLDRQLDDISNQSGTNVWNERQIDVVRDGPQHPRQDRPV